MMEPKGVTMLLIDDCGSVIATASDFYRTCPVGYDLKDAQERRCEDALANAAADAYCSPRYTQAMDHYWKRQIIQNLRNDHGFKVHTIYTGHDDD